MYRGFRTHVTNVKWHVCDGHCMRMCVCTFTRMHVRAYPSTRVCVCTCVLYACVYVCMYACMHTCMYTYMHVCMNGCMCVCMYACMRVCMHVCWQTGRQAVTTVCTGNHARLHNLHTYNANHTHTHVTHAHLHMYIHTHICHAHQRERERERERVYHGVVTHSTKQHGVSYCGTETCCVRSLGLGLESVLHDEQPIHLLACSWQILLRTHSPTLGAHRQADVRTFASRLGQCCTVWLALGQLSLYIHLSLYIYIYIYIHIYL